jgi:hypothetical protein
MGREYSSSDLNASVDGIPPTDVFPAQHATTTLGYVAATDPDVAVRVMAREVADAVHAFKRALVCL